VSGVDAHHGIMLEMGCVSLLSTEQSHHADHGQDRAADQHPYRLVSG
jgi:hypothetical protein